MRPKLFWQSKLVLLAVLPVAGADLVLEGHWYAEQIPPVAIAALGLSTLLGLLTWKLRAATPWASVAGAAITASLIFSTSMPPYQPWRTALVPIVAVALAAHLATRLGRARKERLGLSESRHGRSAAQICANLGFAMLTATPVLQSLFTDTGWFSRATFIPMPLFAVPLAALAEAAADTVSSEIGQAFGGRPRLITTLRSVEPGRDGAISLSGTLAGFVAAAIVAALGAWAMQGDLLLFGVAAAGGAFGLLFDSLLGATIEEQGWLNNDAVNFLSTAAAAAFALALLALLPHMGVG
jgi:uncharacterized protein (TIGR00297 family)